MIVDDIKNWRDYAVLHKIAGVFDILEDPQLASRKDGRYEVKDGRGIHYSVQRYTTLPLAEGVLEAHKDYCDIQFLVSGGETIGYTPVREGLKVQKPYDPGADVVFYEPYAGMSQLKLTAGMFAVFFPQDAHMPKLQTDSPSEVVKVVVKVPQKILTGLGGDITQLEKMDIQKPPEQTVNIVNWPSGEKERRYHTPLS